MIKIFSLQPLMDDLGRDAFQQLREDFIEWHRAGEYEHITFGKDSGFSRPASAREEGMRHVHLIPTYDAAALEQWLMAFERRSRKTSNRVLVYAQGFYDSNKYLFLDILEPLGHEQMDDDDLIDELAKKAEQFRQQY